MRARIHSESHLFSHTRGRLTLSTVIVACIVLLLLSTVCIAGVKWKANGVTVCAEKGLQTGPRIASDGAGGAIITWEDQRSTSAGDIYAQRVNSSGVPQWTAGGVRISKTAGTHLYPQIVSDGAKGAIITWDDYGLGYRAIFAQRVNSSGAKQWAAIGVQVAEAGAGGSAEPAEWGSRVTSDGKNGAMITWMRLVGSQYDIYAGRIKSDGSVPWAAKAISGSAYDETSPQITSDPQTNGAIITWMRNLGSQNDIYCRAIDSNGGMWSEHAVSTNGSDEWSPTITSITGGGGAIISWMRYVAASDEWNVYARSVLAGDAPPWGEQVIATGGYDVYPTITTDGTLVSYGGGSYRQTGAMITWMRWDPSGQQYNIYARRMQWDTTLPWAAKAISTSAHDESSPQISYDGSGAAIISWLGKVGSQYDVYARKIKASGSITWNTETISNSGYNEGVPQLTTDLARGAIITWERYAAGSTNNIYAQRVINPAPSITSLSPTSGKRGSKLTIKGHGFDPPQGRGYVKFGSTKVSTCYSWTSTQIVVKVPSVAYGTWNVRVHNYGGTSNAKSFTVKR